MTAEELARISPERLGQMSDEQLAGELLPLFPIARAAYVGRKADESDKLIVMPSGKRTTLKSLKQENDLIAQTLRKLGIQ